MKKRLIYFMICLLGGGITTQAQYTYTLKQCLEEGLANNYSLRITRNEEQMSKNNATLGNAGYLPTVDLTAGYTGNANNSNTQARATGETTKLRGVYDQTLDAGVDLNWTIFDGFNISTTYKQLKELERQGATNTRIAIEDFIASLTAEYYNYIQQEIRLKNFRYAVSLSRERLRIVEERYHIGNFSRLDYQQATVDFNADRAQYIKQASFTGRVVCIGYAKSGVEFQTKYFVQKELDIRGSRNALPADFHAVIHYMKTGNCPVEQLISSVVSPENASEAMEGWAANPGKVFRILVKF